MCAQEVHTYNKRIEISESMLYIAEKHIYNNTYKTSEYAETVAKLLRLHSSQGRLTGGSVRQALLISF